MKKFVISIIMCLIVASGASAKFRWGPTVGANFSSYSWNQDLFATSLRTGFNAGVMCEVMIPGIGFGVNFGLKYSNRGGICNFGEPQVWKDDNVGNQNLRLHTIQLPINLRFKYTRLNGIENIVAPFAFAGPQINFNVANSDCPILSRQGVSLGLEVGGGVELFKRFQISAGYVWDVTRDLKTYKLDDFTASLHGAIVDFKVLF